MAADLSPFATAYNAVPPALRRAIFVVLVSVEVISWRPASTRFWILLLGATASLSDAPRLPTALSHVPLRPTARFNDLLRLTPVSFTMPTPFLKLRRPLEARRESP